MSGKKITAALVSLTFLLSVNNASATEWTPQEPPFGEMSYGYRISDLSNTYNSGMSVATDSGIKDAWGRGGMELCKDVDDPECQGNLAINYVSVLGTCADSIDSFACIKSVKFRDTNAEFYRFSSDNKVFPQSVEHMIPLGASTEIWRAVIDDKEFLFATKISTNGLLSPQRNSVPSGALEIEIQRVKEIDCPNCYAGKRRIFVSPDGASIVQDAGKEFLNSGKCYVASEKKCFESVSMDLESEISIEIRIPTTWSHWYFGRVNAPKVLQSSEYSISGVSVRDVSISAMPIEVPMVGEKTSDLTKVPEALKMILTKGSNGIPLGMFTNLTGSLQLAWDLGLTWTSVGDRANSKVTRWRLSALPNSDRCATTYSKSTFHGLIYSNSLLFDSKAPSMIDGAISYKVAGRHLSEDGEVLRGFYGMMLSKEYAKCAYSNDLGNITATIAVTDAGTGNNELIVSTVSSDSNHLKFFASGFTFSTKIVSVKVEVAKSALIKEVTPKIKKTIRCMKGNRSISKTGVAPKCPLGYKQSK